MKPEPKYVAETLAWCNKMRKKDGKKPLPKLPKGQKRKAESCPCGKATGLRVFGGTGRYGAEGYKDNLYVHFRVPRAVTRFVVAFDDGRLPQYDQDA